RYNSRRSMPARLKGSRSTSSLRSMRAALAAGCFMSIAPGCSRPPRLAADLVITRANVWTGDPLRPTADAIAVIGDRIAEVGGADDIERWRGPATTVVDAGGRRLVP